VLVFEQCRSLRFHNAVNSGRTRIYFGKLFKNDVLRPLWKKSFFEKFRILKMNITRAIEEVDERTLSCEEHGETCR
jgi:hypothetical protein